MTVNVRPRVGFGRSGRLLRREGDVGPRYAGHYVWVQRKAPFGSFRNVKRVYPRRELARRFSASLPKGRSILRLVLPESQAGVGYVASTSRLISIKRNAVTTRFARGARS